MKVTDMTAEATFEDSKEYIHKKLSTREILCQLAEETAELSQAALKLRRVLDGKNPTPVSPKDAMDALVEEFADVTLCGSLFFKPAQKDEIDAIREKKLARWVRRLKAVEPVECDTVTEACPNCGREVTMEWNVGTDGYKAFCPYCGCRLMLCGECQHPCDYNSETDSCYWNPPVAKRPASLRVETPIGALMAVAENDQDRPGIWVSLRRTDADQDLELAFVECSRFNGKWHITTRVYGDAEQSDICPTRIVHTGIEEYFKTEEP